MLVHALWRLPSWPLGELVELVARDGPHAKCLRSLTIGELQKLSIDGARLARAKRFQGPGFDRIVLEVVAEAGDVWVKPATRPRSTNLKDLHASEYKSLGSKSVDFISRVDFTAHQVPS